VSLSQLLLAKLGYSCNVKDRQEDIRDKVVDFLCLSLLAHVPNDIESKFHVNHPRHRSLLQMSGDILDIGSGDGGMGQLIQWPIYQEGKALIGCDLGDVVILPKGYRGWISGGYENISLDSNFDGVLAIHVIEHLNEWREMLKIAKSVLNLGELIYIEWPVFETISWPGASSIWSSFSELNPKFSKQLLTTFNFYDDNSHTEIPPKMSEVLDMLCDFEVIESGTIYLPDHAEGLVAKGLEENSTANVTMGIWTKFGFAQSILARKIFER
jgi:SAM-dependent methyltransferase